jgi:hypothetical protein
MRQKAEAIMILLAGDQSPDYKDWDGDGERVDPFDGYGFLPNGSQPGYIQALSSEADYAANAPGATVNLKSYGENAAICAQNLAAWAPSLRETLLTILSSPAGSNLDRQISDSIKYANQLMNGLDLDGDQSVELVPGECGAISVLENAYRMADMLLLPISMVPTATATGSSTPSPTSSTPISVTFTPTKRAAEPQNTPVPPAATKPGNRQDDKPKPTKKNP